MTAETRYGELHPSERNPEITPNLVMRTLNLYQAYLATDADTRLAELDDYITRDAHKEFLTSVMFVDLHTEFTVITKLREQLEINLSPLTVLEYNEVLSNIDDNVSSGLFASYLANQMNAQFIPVTMRQKIFGYAMNSSKTIVLDDTSSVEALVASSLGTIINHGRIEIIDHFSKHTLINRGSIGDIRGSNKLINLGMIDNLELGLRGTTVNLGHIESDYARQHRTITQSHRTATTIEERRILVPNVHQSPAVFLYEMNNGDSLLHTIKHYARKISNVPVISRLYTKHPPFSSELRAVESFRTIEDDHDLATAVHDFDWSVWLNELRTYTRSKQ